MGHHTYRTLIVGAGRIGTAVAAVLADRGFEVDLADSVRPPESYLDGVHRRWHVNLIAPISIEDIDMSRYQAVISLVPCSETSKVAALAKRYGVGVYLDATEDRYQTDAIMRMAMESDNNTAFVVQCGLAPGIINYVGYEMVRGFRTVEDLKLRVGSLPLDPNLPLGYANLWSIEGVINEYLNASEVLRDGVITEAPSMDGMELITMHGQTYEAFYTSGGVGDMCQALRDKVRNLDYKSMRYPGHRDFIRTMMRGFDLKKDDMIDLFRRLPIAHRDCVVMYVSATGETPNGSRLSKSWGTVIPFDQSRNTSAIRRITAAGIASAFYNMRHAKPGFYPHSALPHSAILSDGFVTSVMGTVSF